MSKGRNRSKKAGYAFAKSHAVARAPGGEISRNTDGLAGNLRFTRKTGREGFLFSAGFFSKPTRKRHSERSGRESAFLRQRHFAARSDPFSREQKSNHQFGGCLR